jgi:SAM-dependent methyltransferase
VGISAHISSLFQRSNASLLAHDVEYKKMTALETECAVTQDRYETDAANNCEFRLDELISANPQLNGALAIDIGSGTGWLTGWLAGRFNKVESIEPSEAAVKIAKEIHKDKLDRIRWHVGLSEDILPFISTEVPALFTTGRVLSHLTDSTVSKIIIAINRHSKPGSVVCLAELWGLPYHRALWHVRSKDWWVTAFGDDWELNFLPNPIETADRYVGIHGVKR